MDEEILPEARNRKWVQRTQGRRLPRLELFSHYNAPEVPCRYLRVRSSVAFYASARRPHFGERSRKGWTPSQSLVRDRQHPIAEGARLLSPVSSLLQA